MPAYGNGDISTRLRNLINLTHSAQAASMEPGGAPEIDPSAPAFPEIDAAVRAPDPDSVNPFTGHPVYLRQPSKASAPPPRVGQYYGRG